MTAPNSTTDRLRSFLEGTSDDGARDARFCKTLLEKEFVTTAQLEDALSEHERRRAAGEAVRIGEILIGKGFLTPQKFMDAMGIQDVGLRVCLTCGRVYDVAGQPADVKLRCLKCGSELGTAPQAAQAARKTASGLRPAIQVASDTRPRLGKYAIGREIGRGGVAVVYEAEDPELKRRVALKVLKESDATPRVIARLHREAAIAAQLQHPGIVGIHEVSMVRDELGQALHYIAMDLVEGITLAHVLAERRAKLPELLKMLEDVSSSVAFAHSKGVIHRDLKPSNVLIDKSGRVRLTDFGVARAETFDTKLTHTHAVMGTPQYMAPEQVRGRTHDIDARTDVYALGVMLYEIMTGRLPFDADTVADLYRRILEDDPTRPTTLGRGTDEELEAICLKAMEKRREDRYATAQDFAEDLARFRRGDPVQARPASAWRRLGRRLHKHQAVLIPTVVAVGLGVAIGAVAVAALTGGTDPRGVPFVLVAALLNIAVVVMIYRRLKSGKSREEEHAREKARAHTDAGRSLLLRLDRLLSTAAWAQSEVDALADSARDEFRAALQEWPKAAEACLEMARVCRLTGERDDAIEFCTRAIDASAFFPTAHLERAILKLEKYEELRHDRYGRQRPVSDEGLALRKDIEAELELVRGSSREQKELMLASGILAHADGRYEEAAKRLEEYSRLVLTDAEGWKWAGRAWLQIPGRESAADTALSEALKFRPKDILALRLRAKSRFNRGDLAAALADFNAALALKPDDPALLNSRAVCHDVNGDYAAALADYDASLNLRDAAEVHVNRGACHRKRGRLKEALADYDRAIELNKDLADAWMNRGVARKQGGDLGSAIEDFHVALRLAPMHASVWSNLGVALQAQGRTDEAIRAFDEAIRIRPAFVEAWFNRAASKERKKDLEGALSDVNEALRINPKYSLAFVQRGLIRKEKGDVDGAIADYTEALRLNPDDADALAHRGAAKAGKKVKSYLNMALEDYNAALRIDPNNIDAHAYLGDLFFTIGDLSGAKTELEKAMALATPDWANRKAVEELLERIRSRS